MNISDKINGLKTARIGLIETVRSLSTEKMTAIPQGYSNNILWNLGHILAVPAYYFYTAAGKVPPVAGAYISGYMSGTRPKTSAEDAEISNIMELMIPALDNLEQDSKAGKFDNYRAFGGMNFEGVLDFLANHEKNHYNRIAELIAIQG